MLKHMTSAKLLDMGGLVVFEKPRWEDLYGDKTNEEEPTVYDSHYRKMKIQPIDFIQANDMKYAEANVLKYICRHQDKEGRKDIIKAIRYCYFILERDYSEEVKPKEDSL